MRFILVIIFFCFLVPLSKAQDRKTYNYLNFANKPYYFGITLGYNQSNYKVFRSKDFILNDSVRSITSPYTGGFNLGIVTNLKMGQDFDLRLLPTLSFTERNLTFEGMQSGIEDKRRVESVLLEVPFQVRYKSKLYRDFRLFVLAGMKYSYDLSSNSRARKNASVVKIASSDYSFEAGAGIQIFFPYFIFSPEIKFSHGLSNSLLYNRDIMYSSTIDKVLSRAITISFHFEG